MSRAGLDLKGLIVGQLKVLYKTELRLKNGAVLWHCRCRCGNKVNVPAATLKAGAKTSCGCYTSTAKSEAKIKHGHSKRSIGTSSTYNSWRGMLDRCKPEGLYGKRGIKVCERWKLFDIFLQDMGERPEGTELDRRNPKGNYQKSNCRWLDKRKNRQYKTTTVLTRESMATIREWCSEGKSHRNIALHLGISKSTVTGFLAGKTWSVRS
jgi:hypothetical protein